MTIPASARVIEWVEVIDGLRTHIVAHRAKKPTFWDTNGPLGTRSESHITSRMNEGTLNILASFPEPSLQDLVGDALAFIAEHKEGGRLLGFRDGDAWLVYDSSAGGSLGRATLEHWGEYADPGSVVPLVPRQP